MTLVLLGLIVLALVRIDRSLTVVAAELHDHNRWISSLYANTGTSEKSRYHFTINTDRR